MKKLLFLVTLIASLVALPPLAGAKDKDHNKDKDRDEERDKKRWKDARNDVRELKEEYGRLSDRVRYQDASRRLREQVSFIGMDVQRASAQFERGVNDVREYRERVARLNDSIQRANQQLQYELAQRGRRNYR